MEPQSNTAVTIAVVILTSINLAGLALVGYWTYQTQFLLKQLITYARSTRRR